MTVIESMQEKFIEPMRPVTANVLVLLVSSLVIAGLLTSLVWQVDQPAGYVSGDIALQTVRAPYDLIVEDGLTTEKRRADAIADVRPVFSVDSNRVNQTSVQLSSFFSTLRENAVSSGEQTNQLVLTQEVRTEIERRFQLNLIGDEWNIVLNPANWPKLDSEVVAIVQPIVKRGVIADKQELRSALARNQVVLRERFRNHEEEISSENALYDLNEALTKADMAFPEKGFGGGPAFDSVVRKLIRLTLQPNVIFDADETNLRVKKARDKVDASVLKVKRGQVLVREGDLVTPVQQHLLAQFHKERHPTTMLRAYTGHFVLAVTVLLSAYFFCINFWSGFRPSTKDLIVISVALCGNLVLIKLFAILANSLSLSSGSIDSASFLLACPIAAAGVVLQITVGAPAVLAFTLSFALLTGIFLDDSWLLLLLIFCGNLVGAVSVKRCCRRSTFIYAGIRIAGINLLLVACYLLLYPETNINENGTRILCAAIGGVMSGLLASVLTPFVEYFGGYITDIKLLELASLDRPLLRELSLQAPGTWNHSMVMGQIAEAAAEAVGANGLLARVAAFYHDIGKASKPAYFVENQIDRENRHDKLTPSMSALIIKSHVKEGIEMAHANHLPQALIDFIPQHHGNSLIEYFYDKAVKDAEPGELVDESHYRYPGPRPQTKEAGILMLADAVEASSRTLSDPAPAKIQGLVQKIINKVFASGELTECNLTLRDLHLIAKSFTRVLTGIYHRRIEYSEPAEKTKTPKLKSQEEFAAEGPSFSEKGGSEKRDREKREGDKRESGRAASEDESSKHGQDTVSPEESPRGSEEPLKRLGMH